MTVVHILGDWGSTNLRLYRVEEGKVTARLDGPGTTALTGTAAAVLAERLTAWRGEGPIASVTLCGMAGSPAGLVNAPYVPCPATFAQWLGSGAQVAVAGIPVRVLPGLSRRDPGALDVMRGEETQVYGAMAGDPSLAEGRHAFVLPGTHSKWVETQDGAVTSFCTAPTGELYALIAGQSSLTGTDVPGEGTFDEGFSRGLARADEALVGSLFEARAARMLDNRSREWSKGYLSGVLIGAEVARFACGLDRLTIIGAPTLAALYRRALDAMPMEICAVDGDEAALAGLRKTLDERVPT
jgi:2-dehydro-3-deoxygalactonokinase